VLARNMRVSGTVKLHAIVARDGTVRELKVISGHPLLVQAAVEAVRQWLYQPTLLNGEPVEVNAPVDVHFTLAP
jgi:periplasmic protein TonB